MLEFWSTALCPPLLSLNAQGRPRPAAPKSCPTKLVVWGWQAPLPCKVGRTKRFTPLRSRGPFYLPDICRRRITDRMRSSKPIQARTCTPARRKRRNQLACSGIRVVVGDAGRCGSNIGWDGRFVLRGVRGLCPAGRAVLLSRRDLSDLSRRDERTQPGVFTPGTD